MGVDLEQLKQAMDGYGNLRFQLDSLKSNQKTVIETILAKYPDARLEVEEMQEELGEQISRAEVQEKSHRKVLDSMLESYLRDNPVGNKEVISSELLTITATEKVIYDPIALDGYALSNPSILAFRTPEVKTVVRLKPL